MKNRSVLVSVLLQEETVVVAFTMNIFLVVVVQLIKSNFKGRDGSIGDFT